MGQVLYYAAMVTNILALIILLGLMMAVAHQGEEKLILILATVPVVLALSVMFKMPDFEARKLARRLEKAELRKALKALGEEV